MERSETLPAYPGSARGRGKICAARWPSFRERGRTHWHRAQQNSQGYGGQIQNVAWLQRAVRPGLGLSRIADRVQGHAGNEEKAGAKRQEPGVRSQESG